MTPSRRNTIQGLRWPDSPAFTRLGNVFLAGLQEQMLEAVWKGYDQFCAEVVDKIDMGLVEEEIERSITALIEPYIHLYLPSSFPLFLQHGTPETETKIPGKACSPTYDLAFVFYANRRIIWPIEAKVMKTPGRVAKYVADINNEFLTGRYAPFSSSGAMLGYLMSGSCSDAHKNIEKALAQPLAGFMPFFPNRNNYFSTHQRRLLNPSHASGSFTCYHLLMPVS